MYEYFTENLCKALKRCKRYWSVPYEWDKKTRLIKLIINPRYSRNFRMLMRLACFYTLITVSSLCLVISFESNLILKIFSIAVVSSAILLTYFRYMNLLTFHDDTVPFLNAMTIFQRMNANIGKYV
jgi:hypothetical protein